MISRSQACWTSVRVRAESRLMGPIVCGIGRICQRGCPRRDHPVGSPPHDRAHVRRGPRAGQRGRPAAGWRRPRRGHASAERLRRGARRPGRPRSHRRGARPRPAPRSARRAPMTADLVHRSAVELAGLIRARTISPLELVQAYLARIDRWNEALGAYVTVCRERAREEARAAEQALGHGAPLGPLHGVPFAVKDQFDTAGVRTTSGSRLHRDRVPTEDASVVARLRSAGGILLGKLNLTEFALGGTLTHPFGQPRNPGDRTRETGGSSSGSGIAAAAALAAVTLGEDTGGSVRTPAAWCGAVGLRPTWGLVPRSGCVPVAWSMDAPGPLTRSVEDAALLLSIIAGPDGHDRWMQPAPGDLRADLERGAGGLSIGAVTTLVDSPETDGEVREAVRRSADTLRGLGARVEDVDLPLVPMAGAVFMALADGEAAAWHHRTLATRGDEDDAGTRPRPRAPALPPP